jgi:hypothetical protein
MLFDTFETPTLGYLQFFQLGLQGAMNSPPPNLYANQYASNNLNQYQQQNVGGYQGYDMQGHYNAGQGYNHTGVPMPYDPSANQYHAYSAQGGPAMHNQSTYNMGTPTHAYNQQQQVSTSCLRMQEVRDLDFASQ